MENERTRSLRLIDVESTIPDAPGTGGDRYLGKVGNYLDEITELIKAGCPEANIDWIGQRRKNNHFALPYSNDRYDFLAVNTPSSYEQGAIPTKEEPPIGLLRVVASAIRAGFAAGALDAHSLNMSIDEIRVQLEIIRPMLVGINSTSVNVPEGKALAALCNEMNIPYILGGIHATLDPSIARKDFEAALAIVKGDGELAILDILQRVVNNYVPPQPMQGVFYREGEGQLSILHPYAPKINIENVPFFRQEEMVQFPLVEQLITVGGLETKVIEASLYCTRGCPFECGFCSSPVMVGRGEKGTRPYDHPGMDRVVDEVEHMLSIGATAIHFLDDMVIVQPNDVIEFHRILRKMSSWEICLARNDKSSRFV